MRITRPFSVCVILSIATLYGGNFEIDRTASLVAVDAKASPPHSFTSVAKTYEYDIHINPETLEVTEAMFSFKIADLDSNSSKRDKKMRSWMDILMNPEARFELTEVSIVDGQNIGKGTFFMHGLSKPIDVRFDLIQEGDKVILDGDAEFNYTDWNLEIVRLLFFTVKPIINPHFHLEGVLKGN